MHRGYMIIMCSLGGELGISSSVVAVSSYFLPYLILHDAINPDICSLPGINYNQNMRIRNLSCTDFV